MTESERRYHARVTGMAQPGDRWHVRIELTDETGCEVKSLEITDLLFPTRSEAEDMGWRVVEEWVHRVAGEPSAG